MGELRGFGTADPRRPKIGKSKYEIGLYENGGLIALFGTRTDQRIKSIIFDAKRAKNQFEKAFPDKNYETKELF